MPINCNFFKEICSNRESKRIFIFLLLTLFYTLVEAIYGYYSGSIGLLSDSMHMFFDFSALLFGLIASVVSRWPKNKLYTYGYERVEVLAGFVNSLLLIISTFLFLLEAIRRIFNTPDIEHSYLLSVSFIGLIVNLIGILMFHDLHHGGHCTHDPHGNICGHNLHGRSCNHNKNSIDIPHIKNNPSCDDNLVTTVPSSSKNPKSNNYNQVNPILDCNSQSLSDNIFNNTCKDRKNISIHIDNISTDDICQSSNVNHISTNELRKHSDSEKYPFPKSKNVNYHGTNYINKGLLLHIIADALGSISVIISSILVKNYGLMIADPITSIIISILILYTSFPLLIDTFAILMQRVPSHIEYLLPTLLSNIRSIDGVFDIEEFHIWSLGRMKSVCSIKIVVNNYLNAPNIYYKVCSIFKEVPIQFSTIQLITF